MQRCESWIRLQFHPPFMQVRTRFIKMCLCWNLDSKHEFFVWDTLNVRRWRNRPQTLHPFTHAARWYEGIVKKLDDLGVAAKVEQELYTMSTDAVSNNSIVIASLMLEEKEKDKDKERRGWLKLSDPEGRWNGYLNSRITGRASKCEGWGSNPCW